MEYWDYKKQTWNGAKTTFNHLMNKGKFIFRGQQKKEWPLKTSLERILEKGSINILLETSIHTEFSKRAHHYLEYQHIPRSDKDWFSLMQHHGAPTRLLDWSFSPYVAAFFALEEENFGKDDHVVYAIDYTLLRSISSKIINDHYNLEIDSIKKQSRSIYDNEVFKILLDNKNKMVLPVLPDFLNQRISIQQGVFLAPGDLSWSFEENMTELINHGLTVYRIILPHKLRETAISDLSAMNITASTLYPGIDGFSRSLKNLVITEGLKTKYDY